MKESVKNMEIYDWNFRKVQNMHKKSLKYCFFSTNLQGKETKEEEERQKKKGGGRLLGQGRILGTIR